MENRDAKKQNTPVDEAYVMSLMTESDRDLEKKEAPEDLSDEKNSKREKRKAKQQEEMLYGERFLSVHTMSKRGDKNIYIRAEYHERLSRIVQVIGGDRIPLYAYLDNILEHHFELFEKAITEDFNKKNKPLF